MSESMLEFAVGALRSNQDLLLHKVPRSEAVREQLALNLAAIQHINAALAAASPVPEEGQ